MTAAAQAYLRLQGAYELTLHRRDADVELAALGRLCDAAWRELCSERRAQRGHDTDVIAEMPSEQGIPRSERETATSMS